MTREEAIETVRRCCPRISDSECDFETAMRVLVPEFRESEDESIRKELVEKISNLACGCFISQEQKQNFLSYLEKQKELPTNEEMLRTLRAEYEKGVADTIAKYEQKEQKPSINIDQLKSLMLQYLQEAASEKDDSDIEADTDKWARKILGYDFEQKPAEWSGLTSKEAAIATLNHVAKSLKERRLWPGLQQSLIDLAKDIEDLHIVNPSLEWSEEDEKIFWGLTAYIPNEELERLGVTRDDILKKLKSLRPQPIQLKEVYKEGFYQPKQEWSEEDIKMMGDIDLALRNLYDARKRLKIETWLRSLRTRWKPRKLRKRTSILVLLQDITESVKRILALDGKDADVCDAAQDILVAVKSIEGTITEE